MMVRYAVAVTHPTLIAFSIESTSLMTNLIVSTIAAIWIAVIALISVQNASLVSVNFAIWKSIDLPWGLVLAGAVALGFLVGACLPVLGSKFVSAKRR